MPVLDLRTVFVCITVAELALGLGMVLFWRTQRTYAGFGFWAACNVLIGIAYVFFSLRGIVGDFWSIVVANTLIATAISVRVKGLRLFLEVAPRPWRLTFWLPIASFLFLVWFTFVQDNTMARTLWTIGMVLLFLLECGWLLLVNATPATRPVYWTFSAVYLVYAVVMGVRLVAWYVAPENRDLLAGTPINLVAFILLIPLDIAVTMAYLMMTSQRMEGELTASEHAERQQRNLTEALRDSAATLSSTLDLQQVLNHILDTVGRVVPHDAADVMLVDPEGVTSIVQGHGYEQHGGNGPDGLGALHFRVSDALNLREVAATLQPVILDDVTQVEGWQYVAETVWIRSNLTAPIVVEGYVAGFLCLNSATPAFFTAGQAERLAAFADQAAIAIKNARLYTEMRQYAAELETRNQELDAFAHTVAHDLKNPLWGVVGAAELLDHEISTMSPEEIHAFLRDIVRSGQKMNSIIEELLVLATVHKAGDFRFEPLDMELILAEAKARLAHFWGELDVTILEPAQWPATYGHAAWVEEVWVNYLSNATKYGGRPLRIEVGATRLADGMIRCWVRDNGDGIAPEAQHKLFSTFTRLDVVRIEGSGLGLSIVKHIVERLGGEVGVQSSGIPGEGSTFRFTLPGAEQPGAGRGAANHPTT